MADLKTLALYQTFKKKPITSLPEEDWQLSSDVVADNVQHIARGEALAMCELAMQQKADNAAP